MSSIAVLLSSYNRPLQLDGLLRAWEGLCADPDRSHVTVVWRSSIQGGEAAYGNLVGEWSGRPWLSFRRQGDYKADALAVLRSADFIFFLSDDNMATRRFQLSEAEQSLIDDVETLGFSFRLGRGMTYCYPLDKDQRVPQLLDLRTSQISWSWLDQDCDWGYPLEVSSSLYRTSDVLPILEAAAFSNPNQMEVALASRYLDFGYLKSYMRAYEKPVFYSMCVNEVSDGWANRCRRLPNESVGELLARYNEGWRLDYHAYADLPITACHMETDLVLRRTDYDRAT